jgi:tRNA A58 N-methylase Trm61
VLLTRGRDGVVVFVPALTELDETYQYLVASGFCEIRGD